MKDLIVKGDLHNAREDRTGKSINSDVVIIGRFINILDLKKVDEFSFIMGGKTHTFKREVLVDSQEAELKALKKLGLSEAELFINSEVDRIRFLCEKLGFNWKDKVR